MGLPGFMYRGGVSASGPFVNVGDLAGLARALAALGGSAAYVELCRAVGGEVGPLLEAAEALGVAVRAGEGPLGPVYRLGPRGAALAADPCAVEVYVWRGRLRVSTRFGVYLADPEPSSLLSLAYKLAEACGGDRTAAYGRLAAGASRAVKAARGLDRWLAAGAVGKRPQASI